MAGRHSIATRRRARALEMVEVRTNVTHLLTPKALDVGKKTPGNYVGICGNRVIPAPMVEGGSGRYCQGCCRAIPHPEGEDVPMSTRPLAAPPLEAAR